MPLLACGSSRALPSGLHPPLRLLAPHPDGLVVLVHKGGWAGPDRGLQAELLRWPGHAFVHGGWSVESIDYAGGLAGAASVRRQLVRAWATAPHHRLCVYGESSGGHLALLAAALLRGVDCVMTFGAPVDLAAWRRTARRTGDPSQINAYRAWVQPRFGIRPPRWFEPVDSAASISARVLYVTEGGDQILPADQGPLLRAADPRARLYTTTPDAAGQPGIVYLHATLPRGARARLTRRLVRFVHGH